MAQQEDQGCPRDGGHDPRAIFLMWVPAVSFIAIGVTVLLYAAPGGWSLGLSRDNPLLGGLAAAIVLWGLLAGMAWAFRMTSSDNANARSYSDLCQRLHALTARLEAAGPSEAVPQSASSPPSGWQSVGSVSPPASPPAVARVPSAPAAADPIPAARKDVQSTQPVHQQQFAGAGLSWLMAFIRHVNLLAQRLHALTERLEAARAHEAPAGEATTQSATVPPPPTDWQSVPLLRPADLTPSPGDNTDEPETREAARLEVKYTQKVIHEQLGRSGLRWVTGVGYVNLWTFMHRAEEALIEIDTLSNVIAGAINDRMRITRSQLNAESQQQLVSELAQAVSVLEPSALPYLGSTLAATGTGVARTPAGTNAAQGGTPGAASPSQSGTPAATNAPPGGTPAATNAGQSGAPGGTNLGQGGAPVAASQGPVSPPTASETHVLREPSLVIHVPSNPTAADAALARASLRHVRWAVNDFRDGLWDGLVRTRNHLLAALTVTGLITYLLLVLAVAAQMSGATPAGQRGPGAYLQDPVLAGAVFYLVGAVVGLFNLLSNSDTRSDVDDYGLTMVRLLLTPVISGLAAVIGVFVVATLPATFNGQVLSPPTPIATVAPVASPATGASPGMTIASPQPATAVPFAAGPALRPAVLLAQASATATLASTPTATVTPTVTHTPTVTATAVPGSTSPPPVPTLDSVYNLGANRFGLVIAAAFGLTPTLLIGALKRVPDEYKAALSSTQSTARRS